MKSQGYAKDESWSVIHNQENIFAVNCTNLANRHIFNDLITKSFLFV